MHSKHALPCRLITILIAAVLAYAAPHASAQPAYPAKNITIKSNSQNFESKVEAGKEGEWTIDVTPKDTSHPMGTALLVQTDFPKESPKQYYVNAQITAPQPPAMLRAPAQGAPPPTKASTPPAIPTATTGVQR